MVLMLKISQPLQSIEEIAVWVARKIVVTALRFMCARTVRVVVQGAWLCGRALDDECQ